MIKHYLTVAFRNLWKYKVQSVINITGLTIGFVAFFFAVYWYQWEHSFDTFHPGWEKTYAITTSGLFKTSTNEEGEINQLHASDAKVLTAFPEVENVSIIRKGGGGMIKIGNEEHRVSPYRIDSAFFSLFYADFIDGNIHKIPFNDEYIVLNRKTALRLFGTIQCAGKTIPKDQEQQFKIAGVIENYPGNTEFLFDILLLSKNNETSHGMEMSTCFVRLHNKKEADSLREKVESHASVAEDPYGTLQPQRWKFHLRSLPQVHFTCNHSLSERFRNIDILFWTGLLLLICALMNNLVLFIGQQQYKLKNSLTYFSLGAKSGSLITKYLLFLFLPVFIALLLTWGLIEFLFPLFNDFTTISHQGVVIDQTNSMDLNHLLGKNMINTGICLIIYLLVALIPIVRFVKHSKIKTEAYSSGFLRKLLIVGQVFIGSLFFVTSLFLYKQLHFIKNKPKGIDIENVLQIHLGYNTSLEIDMETVGNKLSQVPEVKDITQTVDPLFSPDGMFNNLGILWVEGRDGEKMRGEMERDNFFYVQDNFFRFFNLKFTEGREFKAGETKVWIVNETGKKNIGFDDLLQRTTNGGGLRITGIIQDYHYSPMRYPIQTVVFALLSEMSGRNESYKYIYLKTDRSNIDRIKEAMAEFDKGEVTENQKYVWLTDIEKEFNRSEETIFFIFSVFAFLCILISSFGIYSLVALTLEQREKEIAIRKINGAMFKHILVLFMKEYLILVIVGNIIALPLAYIFIKRWLETYAYHTSINIALFFLVFLITCGIVILSVAKQVMQASKVNPAETLKTN